MRAKPSKPPHLGFEADPSGSEAVAGYEAKPVCDDTEGDLFRCDGCDRRVCFDNCLGARDREEGLCWCQDCYETARAATERAAKQADAEAADSAAYDILMRARRTDAEAEPLGDDLPW